MKKAMIDYTKNSKKDDYFTPSYAVVPLLKYLPPAPLKIWECCDATNKSAISTTLREAGYEVITTDVLTGFNFLYKKPNFDFDMIITNPPYSNKTDFIKRCYSYNKPFALLMPLTALEGVERNELYREHGISLIIFDKRVNFLENKQNWFNTSWYCYDIMENNKMIFEKLVTQ